MIFLAQLLRGVQTSLGVRVEETEEVFAADEVQLRRLDRLGGELVGTAEDRAAHAEYFAGLGDFDDEDAALARGGRQLHAAAADHEHTAGRFPFDEEHGSLRIHARELHGIHSLERRLRHVAEHVVLTNRAVSAAVVDGEVVRGWHIAPHLSWVHRHTSM